MDNKFENLNDRLTVISNQNKSSNQACTSSLSDIHQEVTNLKTEMDKKIKCHIIKESMYNRSHEDLARPGKNRNPKQSDKPNIKANRWIK